MLILYGAVATVAHALGVAEREFGRVVWHGSLAAYVYLGVGYAEIVALHQVLRYAAHRVTGVTLGV